MRGLKISEKGKFVRLKVKYILIGLAVMFVLIPNLIIGVSYTIFDMNWYVSNERIPASYFTQGLLNIYVKMPKLSPFEDVAYYIMGKNYYDAGESNFVIAGGGFKSARRQYSSQDGLKNAVSCHEKAIKGQNSGKYYEKNAQALIDLYYINGDIDKAKKVVGEMKDSKNNYTKNLGYLNESVLLVKLQDYDKALVALNSIEESYRKKVEFDFNRYLGQIYMVKGEERLAKEAFYKSSDFINKLGGGKSHWRQLNYEKIAFGDFEYSDYYVRDDEYKKMLVDRKNIFLDNIVSDENRGDVKGHFIVDGVPMDGALIRLLPKNENSFQTNNIKKYPYEITSFSYVNKSGEFYFNNVPEGIYKVSVILPYHKALNSGLNLTERESQRGYIIMSNFLEVVSRRNLKDGQDYNEKYIVRSECKQYLCISDNEDDNSILKKYETDVEERISIKEEENKIILTNENGYIYQNDILGINTNKYFGKGENIILSKNFLMEDQGYDMLIKSRFEKIVDSNNIESLLSLNIRGSEDYNLFNVVYGEKEQQYIDNEDFKGLLKYYEELYKSGSRDTNVMERLIKLYVLGVEKIGTGKDVNRAIELNEELKELTKNDNVYMQIKRYITMHNQTEFALEKDYEYYN